MTKQISLTGVEWHVSGPLSYKVFYYGVEAGTVGRYPRERTWYFRNDAVGAYGSARTKNQATLYLLSTPAIANLL